MNLASSNNNNIITMAMSEDGSEFLQILLSSRDSRISNLIFTRVFELILELMTHQFGPYLFQKLVESVDENRLLMIMEKLTIPENHIYHASVHKYGSFSVKKLITALKRSPLISYVTNALSNKFEKLMTHPTGRFLAQDPTGNYVVQCVIGLGNPAINDRIFNLLEELYVKLSMAKTESHLVEQCLQLSGMNWVISEFIGSDELVMVAKDRYGNYVVQTALKESKKRDGTLDASPVVKLEEYMGCLQGGHGRNIVTLLKSLQQLIFEVVLLG
ncbi:hypothetical protein V6N11_070952 [Hibiscus sabdariffa]|uniref:PUM-HD domain-containing protein n=1 Tax=Hibiscus sabdariffa TaxID=183260 RepID=A0ABR1ZJG3_9ROSI